MQSRDHWSRECRGRAGQKSFMQKLVTIYLDNGAYGQGKMIVTSYADMHAVVEEHWRTIWPTGGPSSCSPPLAAIATA